jgi:ABC-2 type transport system ATP-binding protein
MLSLDNVRKSFGRTTAVDGISFRLEQGEIFGLLGPNGSGKTTTIRMAAGLLAPDAGSIEMEGLGQPTNPAVRSRIGLAPQTLALYDTLTATENLTFFGTLYGRDRRAAGARASALLEMVGLSDRADDRVEAYSGGMKRRLNLAAALMHEPPLVMLDEPTVGVDPQSRNAIFDIIRTLRERGTTIIYTTHYMEEAQRLCDRVGIIDSGRVLAIDTVDGLIQAHGGDSVVRIERNGAWESTPTPAPMVVLAQALAAEGTTSVHVERPDLEHVFLSLTGRSLRD